MPSESLSMTWRPRRPVDLFGTLGPLLRGVRDPTHQRTARGLWRGCQTPHGPAALLIEVRQEVHVQAWGPGAQWSLAGVPQLLGAEDDLADFTPQHSAVRQAWHRRPGWRVPRTQLVLESLIPAIIEQKVTSQEAFGAWRRLVSAFGAPAPGPAADLGLMVPPSSQAWARIPSWEWLRCGVDQARSRPAGFAARRVDPVERSLLLSPELARARLESLPGVGVWTAAETLHRAHGDADAVSFGDYHVAKNIGWVLLGRPIDDAELAELLAPYAPHRYRVQRLL
ncbi:MAG: DNA-3-methyladenine glycosylase family protein, partial [Angustibacter sp.]